MGLFSLSGKRVWVAGDRGMLGAAVVRRLACEACEVVTVARDQLDLRDQGGVRDWLVGARPQVVVLTAAKVGGVLANSSLPVDFLLDNLLIETAVIASAHAAGVEKLLFVGSSCIYPKLAPQPIVEGALLTGPLDPTNTWYAVAKIAGIKLVQAYRRQDGSDFISAVPTNLFGPGDNYDLDSGQVMAALIRKVHTAKQSGAAVVVWGTGSPRREFLHVEDCADACVHLLKAYSGEEHVNVGTGRDISILDLTRMVMDVVGYSGAIMTDPTRPDGPPRKLLDSGRLAALGWQARIRLRDGITHAYRQFLADVR